MSRMFSITKSIQSSIQKVINKKLSETLMVKKIKKRDGRVVDFDYERVLQAINHQEPDRVPLDLGATGQSGISASTLYKFRKALGLDEHPVCVHEPFQILGQVEQDLRDPRGRRQRDIGVDGSLLKTK